MKGIYRYSSISPKYISILIFHQAATLKDGAHSVRTGVSADDVKQKVISETAKRVYSSFSSVRRPSPSFVAAQFKDLEKEGLGKVAVINRSTVFFKKVPEYFINEEYKLGKHNTSLDAFYETNQRLDLASKYPWQDDAQRWKYLPLPEQEE